MDLRADRASKATETHKYKRDLLLRLLCSSILSLNHYKILLASNVLFSTLKLTLNLNPLPRLEISPPALEYSTTLYKRVFKAIKLTLNRSNLEDRPQDIVK